MPTLETTFAGIPCLNPFWLASAPPTNAGEQIMRAFDAGWGGAVWKTIGEPITNVSSRYSALDYAGIKMLGFNNIELISDRPTEVNLREIAEVKRRYPKHVVIASLMVESKREAWHDIVQRAEDAGADGLELNFGCPHGMSERGMGAAVGQVPEYCQQITAWVKEKARTPVIVKLTPNIGDIRLPARAARAGGADALSAINTINSITGIDLDTLQPRPNVDGKSSHGGYCGPAVKPIALNMVQQVMSDPTAALPMSGIGGIGTWQDAAEFMLLGAGTVQVCTAAMHFGYRIVEDMADGLLAWMQRKGYNTLDDFRGLSLPNMREWKNLNLNFRVVARIHASKCIGCQLCYTACWDGAHQCIHLDRADGGMDAPVLGTDPRYTHAGPNPHAKPTPAMVLAQSAKVIATTPIARLDLNSDTDGLGGSGAVTPLQRIPRVDEDECVGCNLCSLVCPVPDCITMERVDTGLPPQSWEERVAAGMVPEDTALAGNPNL
jgi:dihydropyrimidine dehydrogenase (NAD+) subunit PreA